MCVGDGHPTQSCPPCKGQSLGYQRGESLVPVNPAVSEGVLRALSPAWEQPGAMLPGDWLLRKGTPPFLVSLQDARAHGSCLHR